MENISSHYNISTNVLLNEVRVFLNKIAITTVINPPGTGTTAPAMPSTELTFTPPRIQGFCAE